MKKKYTLGFVEIVILVIILILGIIAITFYLFKGTSDDSEIKFNPLRQIVASPTRTSPPGNRPSGSETFAFQDLTIPYLRQREYQSSLGGMEKIGENSSYTSYIINYNSDGLKVNGLLTIPKGEIPRRACPSEASCEGGWPAVIFIHGYIPPEVYKTRVNYVSWIDYLAKNGFVVFKIDLRGHDQSEGVAGGAYYSSDYVADTLNAYSALQNADFVNPDAIGLWGHSMAGNVVFRSLAVKPDIPAVVIWAGAGYTYTDLQDYSIQDNSYRPPPADSERARKRQLLRDTYGNFDPNHWFWKQVPATNYLDGITGAVQLNHAVDDSVVSIEYSRNLNEILKSANIHSELNEYTSGGHNLTGSSFSAALQKTAEFFRIYLK